MLRMLKILFISIIGFGLGFSLWHFSRLGYFQQWTKLTPGPQADVPSYFAPSSEWDITKPCSYSGPEFSPLARPPKNIVSCAEHGQVYPEAYRKVTYALDNQGAVWKWELFSYGSPTAFFEMLCFPGIGLLAGFLVALSIELSLGLKQRLHRRNNRIES